MKLDLEIIGAPIELLSSQTWAPRDATRSSWEERCSRQVDAVALVEVCLFSSKGGQQTMLQRRIWVLQASHVCSYKYRTPCLTGYKLTLDTDVTLSAGDGYSKSDLAMYLMESVRSISTIATTVWKGHTFYSHVIR